MNDSKLRRIRDRASGAATLINEGCKITGEVTGTGDFLVSGEIAGDCDIEGSVTVTASGLWQGTIRATNVIVAGHIEGDVTASAKVEITNTARITGKVTGEAIAVAEGAVVEGIMKTTGQNEPHEFVEKRNA